MAAAVAQVHVTLVNAGPPGQDATLIDSHPLLKQAFTATATSQASTIVAAAPVGNEQTLWWVQAGDSPIWIKFAPTPTAAAGSDWLLAPAQVRAFRATVGDKIAVILA